MHWWFYGKIENYDELKEIVQLIKTSPELLEAAEELLKDLDRLGIYYPSKENLKEIIARAKGEN